MSNHYRVVDPYAADDIDGHIVTAPSPEKAAAEVCGMELVRSGAKADLVAKVYWQVGSGGLTNMVRLYQKANTTQASRRDTLPASTLEGSMLPYRGWK